MRLRNDPSSHTAASAEGWEFPFPRLEAMVADLWDLTYQATGSKVPAKYPRPFQMPGAVHRRGDAGGRTPDEVKRLLREKFGQPEAPV